MQTARTARCYSSNSTPRSHKRGLSLTSQSRCQSARKNNTSQISIDTGLTGTSFFSNNNLMCNGPKQTTSSTYVPISNGASSSFSAVENPNMPKVTFKYTNRPQSFNFEEANSGRFFISQTPVDQPLGYTHSKNTPSSDSSLRFQPRQTEVIKQVTFDQSDCKSPVTHRDYSPHINLRTSKMERSDRNSERKSSLKNRSQHQSSQNEETSPNKCLIDSRKIRREFLIEDRTKSREKSNEKSPFKAVNSSELTKSIAKSNIMRRHENTQSQINQNGSSQHRSPYHLLASDKTITGHKTEQKSEEKLVKNEVGVNHIHVEINPKLTSLEQIPQVQEFIVEVGSKQICGISSNSKSNPRSQIKRQNQTYENQKSQEFSFEEETPALAQRNNGTLHPVKQSNRGSSYQGKKCTDRDSRVQFNRISVHSREKSRRRLDSSQADRENVAPIQERSSQHRTRSTRSIRAIERRLEQIISICEEHS